MNGELEIVVTEAPEDKLDRNIDKDAFCETKLLGSRAVNSFNHYRLYTYRNLLDYIAFILGDSAESLEEVMHNEMKYVGRKTAKLIVRHLQEQGFFDYILGRQRQMLLSYGD